MSNEAVRRPNRRAALRGQCRVSSSDTTRAQRRASRSPTATRRDGPRIVVAFDGGPAARAALAQAASLARNLRGELFVVHAATPRYSSFERPSRLSREVARTRARGQTVLMRASEVLGSRIRWRPDLLVGEPAEVIPKRARELAADMLVVGSSGRGALARLLEGSVSRAIVGQAAVPVLIVPATTVTRPTALRRAMGAREVGEPE